jgi:hypothetical protein
MLYSKDDQRKPLISSAQRWPSSSGGGHAIKHASKHLSIKSQLAIVEDRW